MVGYDGVEDWVCTAVSESWWIWRSRRVWGTAVHKNGRVRQCRRVGGYGGVGERVQGTGGRSVCVYSRIGECIVHRGVGEWVQGTAG